MQLLELNGHKVKNLQHLLEILQTTEERFLKFSLDHGELLVLENEAAKKATQEVLEIHSIPSSVSEDLRHLLKDPMTAEEKESTETETSDKQEIIEV